MAEQTSDGPPELLAPVDVTAARTLTGELRDAIADVGRAGAVLAERVRRAHRARVWLALGYTSWADYAHTELGISRAQAYRLIEIATTTQSLLEAGTALGLSPAGDIGLSGRALRDLHGRVEEFAAELAERVAAAGGPIAADDVTALMRDVARAIRTRPAPRAVTGRPEHAKDRALVEQLHRTAAEIGELILEFAPAYQPETDVAELVSMFANDIGLPADEALAYRRYAITGDVRCLDLV
ncbi:hypothetical protein ACW2Q0_21075 [Nocardia sp. R16R-3T]